MSLIDEPYRALVALQWLEITSFDIDEFTAGCN
jgi:hypothetical protein